MNIPEILYEDGQILVAVKSAGVAVQSASVGQPDMESMLKVYLAGKGRERIPSLYVIHRLDQPVEGVLVFAKTKAAAAGLNRQLTAGQMNKEYLAVVEAQVTDTKQIQLTDYMKKDRQQAVITDPKDPAGKKAELLYRCLAVKEDRSLLDIQLMTGRFHQIRCQLSKAGMPIAGDVRYGGTKLTGRNGIALCACRLSFIHPGTKKPMQFVYTPKHVSFAEFNDTIATFLKNEEKGGMGRK